MTSEKFPWGILVWSAIGTVVLRQVFSDDIEWLGACLIYGVLLGLVAATLEFGEHED
jgi:hypothetical protein